ncbi:unnamed protein product, partial [Medioppia subpectinata]
FKFTHLSINSYRLVICVLLFFKVFTLILFSSQILCITIETPFSVIDSIEELNQRPDLSPIVFVPEADIDDLKLRPDLSPIVFVPEADIDDLKSDSQLAFSMKNVKEENYLEYDYQKLFEGINPLIKNISVLKTHVLLAPKNSIELTIALNKERYEKITHLSKTRYKPRISVGFSLYDTKETGLSDKWSQSGLQQAFNTYGDKSFEYELKGKQLFMILDEMRIALGPFLTDKSLDLWVKRETKVFKRQTIRTQTFIEKNIDLSSDESFCVLKSDHVIERHEEWQRLLPRVKQYFSLKFNSFEPFLRILSEFGFHFEVSNRTDLNVLDEIGVNFVRVLSTNCCKSDEFVAELKSRGISLLCIDCEHELQRVVSIHATTRVLLRLCLEKNSKFGLNFELISNFLQKSKSLRIKVIGVSIRANNALQLEMALIAAKMAFDLGFKAGLEMKVLDICGDFSRIEDISHIINENIETNFKNTTIIAEMSRFFTEYAFVLFTKIIAKRKTAQNIHYYLNDGIFGSFRDVYVSDRQPEPNFLLINDWRRRPVHESIVWGPTCDSSDCVLRSIEMPELFVGEWVLWEGMGSHCYSPAKHSFNGISLPKYKLEIENVLKSGAKSEEIIFANPCKSDSVIEYALRMGTDLMTFDNCEELRKIRKLFPNARLVLRLKVDDKESAIRLAPLEIENALKNGAKSEEIIFANPCKSDSVIEYALRMGTDLMTFDNCEELRKIRKLFPNARLVLRLKVDDKESAIRLSLKFGADMTEVRQLLQTAREWSLDVIGVAFHVGTGCQRSESFAEAIELSRKAFDLALSLGFNMRLLDIGGGFPGKECKTSFEEICETINESLEKYFPSDHVLVMAEPGRYVCESAFSFVSPIVVKKSDEKQMQYYLNASIFNVFNNVVFENQILEPIPLLKDSNASRDVFTTTLWGDSCVKKDCIRRDFQMIEMNAKEWLLFKDLGSYSLPFKHFCFPFDPKTNFVILEPIPLLKDSNASRDVFTTTLWGDSCVEKDCIRRDFQMIEMNAKEWLLFKDLGSY